MDRQKLDNSLRSENTRQQNPDTAGGRFNMDFCNRDDFELTLVQADHIMLRVFENFLVRGPPGPLFQNFRWSAMNNGPEEVLR